MPNRKYQSSSQYRYGFNGKENDIETVGTGEGTQDYGMRIYNPSLGKFLSVDPLAKKYAMLTPYQFASNRPIDGIDLDGSEWLNYKLVTNNGKSEIQLVDIKALSDMGRKMPLSIHVNYNGLNFTYGSLGEAQLAVKNRDYLMSYEHSDEKRHDDLEMMGKDLMMFDAAFDAFPIAATFAKDAAILESRILKSSAYEFVRTETLSGNKAARGVGEYMAKIANGEAIEAIEVAVINGVNYVVNGHHRLEAAIRTGTELEYKILQPSQWSKYYKTEQEIIEAAAMTGKPKLDSKVITKAKDEYVKPE